jgi:hypothetical protein
MQGDFWNIRSSLTERRQTNFSNIQPIIQVAPKLAVSNGLMDINIGRSNDSYINFMRLFCPYWFNQPILEDSKQLGLCA